MRRSNLQTPKYIKWHEVDLLDMWKIDNATVPQPHINPNLNKITQHNDRSVNISFARHSTSSRSTSFKDNDL
uniref:Uncharacterized protein n=1 Tax=Rhizophora mucronata TaxID=61149 RepID=A0A2P2NLY2_RHIMU